MPLLLLSPISGIKVLTVAGAGMVATVVVGWPVLLLAGALSDLANPQRR